MQKGDNGNEVAWKNKTNVNCVAKRETKKLTVPFADIVKKTPKSNKLNSSKSSSNPGSRDNTKRTEVIIGTSVTNDSLKSASQRSLLFVSRVSPNVTCEGVLSYISEKGISDVECTQLKTRYASYKSFKVSVPSSSEKDTLNPSFWPNGVLVRSFIPSKRETSGAPFLGRTFHRTITP
jgi:hypothetical protein